MIIINKTMLIFILIILLLVSCSFALNWNKINWSSSVNNNFESLTTRNITSLNVSLSNLYAFFYALNISGYNQTLNLTVLWGYVFSIGNWSADSIGIRQNISELQVFSGLATSNISSLNSSLSWLYSNRNPFDQWLNTTSDVKFHSVSSNNFSSYNGINAILINDFSSGGGYSRYQSDSDYYFNISASWEADYSNANDGNYDTYSLGKYGTANAYIYMNFTMPSNIVPNSTHYLDIKRCSTGQRINVTVPPDCLNVSVLRLQVQSLNTAPVLYNVYVSCYNYSSNVWRSMLASSPSCGSPANSSEKAWIYEAQLLWNTTGSASSSFVNMTRDLIVEGDIYSSGLYINGSSIFDLMTSSFDTSIITQNISTLNMTLNSQYVPYNGSRDNLDLGTHNLYLNGSVGFTENSGIISLWYMNHTGGDSFKAEYWYDFEVPFDDWMIFHKTDGNDATPDGGIGFVFSNMSGDNITVLKIDGYKNANFTDYNINTLGNVSAANLCYSNGSNCLGTPADVTQNITTLNSSTLHLDGSNWGGDSWITWVSPNFVFNESKLSTKYYNATQSSSIAGTISGLINYTQHPDGNYDSLTLNITEAAGSPALDVRINFTDVESFNAGVMRYYTSSISGDLPVIQLWSYDDGIWEDYPYVASSLRYAIITQPVFDSSSHVNNSVVQMRLYKSSNGNINNNYYIDWITVSKGYGTPAGEEVDPFWSADKKDYYNRTVIDVMNNTLNSIGNYSRDSSSISGNISDLRTNISMLITGANNNFTYLNTTTNQWNSTATAIYPRILNKKIGINMTNPSHQLEINSLNKALNVSNILFVDNATVGVGTSSSEGAFEVYAERSFNVSNPSSSSLAFFNLNNISAGNLTNGILTDLGFGWNATPAEGYVTIDTGVNGKNYIGIKTINAGLSTAYIAINYSNDNITYETAVYNYTMNFIAGGVFWKKSGKAPYYRYWRFILNSGTPAFGQAGVSEWYWYTPIQNSSMIIDENGRVGFNTLNPKAAVSIIDENYEPLLIVGDGKTDASGYKSVSIGEGCNVTGSNSIAMGYYSNASGQKSVSLGDRCSSTGGICLGRLSSVSSSSYSVGESNYVSGAFSHVIGYKINATNTYSKAFGNNLISSGTGSLALGNSIQADGDNTVAIGLDSTYRNITTNNIMAVMGGRVGIGVFVPNATLDINGTLVVNNTLFVKDNRVIIGNLPLGFSPFVNQSYKVTINGNLLINQNITVRGSVTSDSFDLGNENYLKLLAFGNVDDGTSLKRNSANATYLAFNSNSFFYQALDDDDIRYLNSTGISWVAFRAVNQRMGIRTVTPAEALEVNGNIQLTGTLISNSTSTLGWTAQYQPNTACTTTCVKACASGFAISLGGNTLVNCTDATADQCLCAGGS